MTVKGLDVPVAVNEPGDDVTVYPVIALPLARAPLNVTVAWAFPAVAVTVVGAVGANDAELTVNVAAVLVTLPAVLLITHSYLVPLLAVVVAGVVYEEFVAPLMAVYVEAPVASCIH